MMLAVRDTNLSPELLQRNQVELCLSGNFHSEMEFLSKTALELVDLPPDEDIYYHIASRLHKFLNNPFIVTNYIDEETRTTNLKSIIGIGNLTDRVLMTLGRSSQKDVIFQMTEDARTIQMSGKLHKLKNGLYQLMFEKVPRIACLTVEKMLSITGVYSIGFVHKDKLLGNLVILMRHGATINNPDFIEAYVNQAAIAIMRRRSEEALMRSERQYRYLVENAFDAIYLLRDRHYEYVNPRFCEITGYSFEEITSSSFNFNCMLPVASKKIISDRYEARLRGLHIPNEYRIQIIRKDGTKVNLEVSTVSISEPGEVAVLGIMRDITERIKSEEIVQQMNKELEIKVEERTIELNNTLKKLSREINIRRAAEEKLLMAKEKLSIALEKEKELSELKSRFIKTISHEYRTPLTVIMSSTSIMEYFNNGDNKEEVAAQINKIQHSIKDMTKLLDDIFSLDITNFDNQSVSKKQISLEELAVEIIDEVKRTDRAGHNIEFEIIGETSTYSSDGKLIRHIIMNLMVNALKYSDGGKTVKLIMDTQDANLAISVIDQGWGIPDEEKSIIFEPFYRGKKHIGLVTGTGLGLTIVKRCVDALKGTINVDSNEEGSTFTVRIP